MVAPTPRVFLIRHGQTEWSLLGRYTSVTDISLTPVGTAQMLLTGKYLFGEGPMQAIKPQHLTHIISSPRKRATESVELMLESLPEPAKSAVPLIIDENVREWEYGDYEGKLTKEICQMRKERGLSNVKSEWQIWGDGCENGETHLDVEARLDTLITRIRDLHQRAFESDSASDIIVVAHGHILRCLAARWLGNSLDHNPQFLMDTGGICVLSYQHHNIHEPALALLGPFVVPLH